MNRISQVLHIRNMCLFHEGLENTRPNSIGRLEGGGHLRLEVCPSHLPCVIPLISKAAL